MGNAELISLIERYGEALRHIGNLSGTRYAHLAGDFERDANVMLDQIKEAINQR